MAGRSRTKSYKKKKRRNAQPELRPAELLLHIYLAAMLGVFALFTYEEKYTMMDNAKYAFLSVGAYLLAFALICVLVHTLATRRRTFFAPGGELLGALDRITALDYAVLAYFFVGFVSMLASRDPAVSFSGGESRNEGYLVMLCYCLIYFSLSRFYVHRDYIFLIFAASMLIVSVTGILQFYGVDWLNLNASAPPITMPFGAATFQSTLGNVNVLSTVMCFAIPMFAVLYVKTDSRLRFVYLSVALACWLQELMAQSDSGFIGLAVGFVLLLPFIITDFASLAKLLVFSAGAALTAFVFSAAAAEQVAPNVEGISALVFGLGVKLLLIGAALMLAALAVHFFLIKKERSFKKLRLAAACVTIVCIAAALLVGWFYPAEPDGGFLYEYTEAMRGNMRDEFGSYRGFVWSRSLALYTTLPVGQKLIGVGPGMFAGAFLPVYYDESVAITGTLFDRAHNEYIQTLVTMGVLGLLAYLAFLVISLARAWKHFAVPAVLALGSALLCYYIQAFFNFSVTMTTPFFWIFLGILASQAPKLELKGLSNLVGARSARP